MSLTMFDQFPRGIVCRRAVRLAADADAVWAVIGNAGSIEIARARMTALTLRLNTERCPATPSAARPGYQRKPRDRPIRACNAREKM